MISIDLIRMLGNLSQSLFAVQSLISGLSYLLGILFIMSGLFKFKEIVREGSGRSQTSMSAPFAQILGGGALLYLPSMIQAASNTAFGSSSILQYTTYAPYNIYSAMRVLIQTAGLIWFVRGCAVLVSSSHTGGQNNEKNLAAKGLMFVIAGVFAINFEGTISMLTYALTQLMSWFNHTPPK